MGKPRFVRAASSLMAAVLAVSMVPAPAFAHAGDESTSAPPAAEAAAESEPAATAAPAAAATAAEPDSSSAEAAAVPAAATAEEQAPLVAFVPEPGTVPDSDELFAQHVERTLYAEAGVDAPALYGSFGETRFTGLGRIFYDEIKASIRRIASGEQPNAIIEVSLQGREGELEKPRSEWSESELNELFGMVFYALLADCPYDLYWFDKVEGIMTGMVNNKGSLYHTPRFEFIVSKDYAAPGATTQAGSPLTVNATKARAAAKTVEAAKTVVSSASGLTDAKKIEAYRDWVCDAVSYDRTATNSSVTYGDPWQLINVFDNNPSTNVVCEGYAKALQYLCDLTGFSDAASACYTVSGELKNSWSQAVGEPHMWNILTLRSSGGKMANYLVDLTNTDGSQAGSALSRGVFLNGAKEGSIGRGYAFARTSGQLVYVYDPEQKALYGTGSGSVLNLATADFVPLATDVQTKLAVATEPAAQMQTTYGTPASLSALANKSGATCQWFRATSPTAAGSKIAGATATTYRTPAAQAAGTYYYYYCEFSLGGQKATTRRVCVTVAPKTVTASIAGSASKTYNATKAVNGSNRLSIALAGVLSADQRTVSAVAGSYEYDSAQAGTRTIIARNIRLTGKAAANYRLSSTQASKGGFSIARRTVTVTPTAGQSKVQGAKDPVLKYQAAGLVGRDRLTGALARQAGEKAGSYNIVRGKLAVPQNYTLAFKAGVKFTIKAKAAGSWKKSGGKYWYQKADGSYPRNAWYKVGGAWYHFDKAGYMQTGWLKLGKTWYYLKSSGAMTTGWKQIGKSWYYFNGSGAMASSRWVGDYYLQKSGVMATNQWIGNYWVNGSGKYTKRR
ncbi:MBG domain-containing protein [Xiamenia xianingshaonis]|uniref:Uncharacterized protein n=2 Tax=Xiamenia xianingshaonis TaxID=2682776 RepID=A0A9E6SUJ1_9ACTN|nr:MBG domain-containing protein [Xiamenia xianingshaonis]QTU84580.1 hypothetical protein J7S26_01205 [Xiamenia xianingshaonis]